MPSSAVQQSGVVIWKHKLLHSEPMWSREPDVSIISSIARHHLRIPEASLVSATFLGQGAFNKVYVITSSSLTQSYIFRVTLPVDPFYKTASEVATLSYIRNHTSIPVADVIAYSASADSQLGFEWILMERVPGVCMQDVWSKYFVVENSDNMSENHASMPWEKKEELIRVVTKYLLELRKISFKCIGSLYFASDINKHPNEPEPVALEDSRFVIGPLVSMNFFYGGIRALVPRQRGPFKDERRYIEALLNVVFEEVEMAQRLPKDDPLYHEDLVGDRKEILDALNSLQTALPSIFSCEPDPNGYILSHHDLSLSNIMVDPETFKIAGIIDWECIGTIPRWEDVFPRFLTVGLDIFIPEPPKRGSAVVVECWENWEKVQLRILFNKIVGEASEVKRQFISYLNDVTVLPERTMRWAQYIQARTRSSRTKCGDDGPDIVLSNSSTLGIGDV